MKFESNVAVYIQISNMIINKIVNETYKKGDKIPSIRTMAQKILVNQNTVIKAYKELEDRNIIEIKRGLGFFVTENDEIIKELKKEKYKTTVHKFINNMHLLGYNNDEIIEIIKKELKC